MQSHLVSLVLLVVNGIAAERDELGTFWQLTDIHYDVNYSSKAFAPSLCLSTDGLRNSSSGGAGGGPFGDYNCDSPWELVKSAAQAMKTIQPNPDFILWTGDSVPHVPDSDIDSLKVFQVMNKVVELLQSTFPGVKIFPTVGNHDVWPAHQIPLDKDSYYENVLNLAGYNKLLGDQEKTSFRKGGYYSTLLSAKLRLISVNSNLWYNSDHSFDNSTADPASQFNWLEMQMINASENQEKVLLTGHIPPGVFGRSNGVRWFKPQFNQRFSVFLKRFRHLIAATVFGHEHTDGFRVVYDSGLPVIGMFMAPAVTPWFSTLPGTGSNNPGIRLYKYSRSTKSPGIFDYSQYFVNLTEANTARQANWIKEYQATELFDVPDVSPSALHNVLTKFRNESTSALFDRYYLYNSVSQDVSACVGDCRRRHICAASNVEYDDYDECVKSDVPYLVERRRHHESTTPDDPHHRHHPNMERFTYFVVGALIFVIVILFVILALCCCHRRHAVLFFRRNNYVLIQETA